MKKNHEKRASRKAQLALALGLGLAAAPFGTGTAFAQSTAAITESTSEAAATPANSPARVANGSKFGQWVVSCEALAVNETACVLKQRLARSSDGAFLAEMLAFASADGSRQFLAARVPNGVYFPHGFAVKPAGQGADPDAEEIRFVWQSCGADLCEALIELDDATFERLEAAEKLVAGYRPNLLAQPLVFAFSVKGAKAGLDALNTSKTN